MRKLPLKLLPALLAICFISCKKENLQSAAYSDESASSIISVSLAPGETYTYNFSEAGKVSIVKQAAHFSVSTSQTGELNPSYTYAAAANYTGSDEVVLQFDKSSGSSSGQLTSGCTHTTTSATVTSSFTTLKIQVGE